MSPFALPLPGPPLCLPTLFCVMASLHTVLIDVMKIGHQDLQKILAHNTEIGRLFDWFFSLVLQGG